MKKYKIINTFSQSPSIAQIISYLLFLMQVLVFFIIIQKRYESRVMRIVVIIVYSICVVFHVVVTFLTSLSDPSDDFMIKFKNDRDTIKNEEIMDLLYCDTCRSYVKLSSKHCRICQRCVQNFDHHCIWINNCVGSKNYRLFFVMIIVSLISMGMFIVSLCLLWWQGKFWGFLIEMGFVWACGIIVSVFCVLILNLILLHVYLQCLGMTTYNFIMMDKNVPVGKVKGKQQEMTQQVLHEVNKDNVKDTKERLHEMVVHQLGAQQSLGSQSHRTNDKKIHGSVSSEKQYRSSKANQIAPQMFVNKEQNNIFEDDHESIKSSASKAESIKISEFFTKNKSLKLLVSNDVINPLRGSRQIIFPKTCNNNSGSKERIANSGSLPL